MPVDGVVQIRCVVNGVPHIVRRAARTSEVSLKIGAGDFTKCSEADIRDIIPIQAYSQKQLSNVGIRLEELQRFLVLPIHKDLADIDAQLRSLAGNIRDTYFAARKIAEIQAEIRNHELERRSIEQQLAELRTALAGLTLEDQQLITAQPSQLADQSVAQAYRAAAETVVGSVQALEASLKGLRKPMAQPDGPNDREVRAIVAEFDRLLARISDVVTALRAEVTAATSAGGAFHAAMGALERKLTAYEELYAAAKERAAAHNAKLAQLTVLEARQEVLLKALATNGAAVAALSDTANRLDELRQRWQQTQIERSALMAREANRLTTLSGGALRVSIKAHADNRNAVEALKNALSGSGVKGSKLEALGDSVVEHDAPLRRWMQILDELNILISPSARRVIPALAAIFTETELARIATKLTAEKWLELATTRLNDVPVFEYQAREDEYMKFKDASAGQQATVLLRVLLAQEGAPLIIDQPEEDLDNQVIVSVIEDIWKAKQKRQLIFASHNANLVVNGDAELVVCCDYRVTGDQSGGTIRSQGAIDVPTVRGDITTIMEGGRDAFTLRQQKYGF